jgi:hypothetical protein
MNGLTTALLARACRVFLTLAYPGGEETIPANRRPYLRIDPDQPLASLLPPAAPPDVCQPVRGPGGVTRGYAYRLGSAHFPHLKLQVSHCDQDTVCVFAVDTHDKGLCLPPTHPDYEGAVKLQTANRQLKEKIERAWEEQGLLTFNAVLRRDLEK